MSRFVRGARRGENFWLLYVIVVILVMIGFWVGTLPFQLITGQLQREGLVSSADLAAFNETADFTFLGLSSHIGLLLLLGSFIAAAIFLLIAVEFIHRRPFSTLINPTGEIKYRKIGLGFGLWFGLTILAEIVFYAVAPESYTLSFQWRDWLPLMVVCLFVLPVQTSFEEVFTRGYLLQGFALATRSRWLAIILSSVFFMSMHLMNPEIREFGAGVMITYYMSVGIFLAALTILDDGLEYALGIHAAVNIYGAGFVSYQGSALNTDALIKVSTLNPMLQLVLFYIMMIIFYLIIKRINGLKPLKDLFTRIELDFEANEDQSTAYHGEHPFAAAHDFSE